MEDEQLKELRAQRHDFIKEYYKMATADLDRHLKAGWQTIAVLAGGAVFLTAGHDGKIGMPIATTIALVASLWGALTVIDSNYWSLRAIAFLANVEAIYFAEEDRRYFNPYIGSHPPFKLLDSLRYMLWLCLAFGLTVILNACWELGQQHPTFSALTKFYNEMTVISYVLWCVPILVFVWGLQSIFRVWAHRVRDYLEFSEKCSGPGLRNKILPGRSVMVEHVADVNKSLQDVELAALRTKQSVWTTIVIVHSVIAFILSVSLVYFFTKKIAG